MSENCFPPPLFFFFPLSSLSKNTTAIAFSLSLSLSLSLFSSKTFCFGVEDVETNTIQSRVLLIEDVKANPKELMQGFS
ncbi:hypothetical protein RchiOBHm_Chr1g0371131 [Rosa chinensis]|uniref:Uncharacterized protein n=1 Tax=Rosa chinensis TaxID=74649 RepID=A0A2P6SLH7_ROSCH|nr:hypothetical protein RchiOBHm_Chr1g0371131 [Rosa chinensis]